jgi:hypothetical protein
MLKNLKSFLLFFVFPSVLLESLCELENADAAFGFLSAFDDCI